MPRSKNNSNPFEDDNVCKHDQQFAGFWQYSPTPSSRLLSNGRDAYKPIRKNYHRAIDWSYQARNLAACVHSNARGTRW